MLNRITLMGRLTCDPELRHTQSGNSVASFTLACDRDYAAQGAEKETDFIDVVAWRNTADFVSKYFSKGRMVVVSGRLQIRNWEDKDGNKRKTAEIVAESVYFGDSKRDWQTASSAAPAFSEFKPLPSTTPVPFSSPDMPQMEIENPDELPY